MRKFLDSVVFQGEEKHDTDNGDAYYDFEENPQSGFYEYVETEEQHQYPKNHETHSSVQSISPWVISGISVAVSFLLVILLALSMTKNDTTGFIQPTSSDNEFYRLPKSDLQSSASASYYGNNPASLTIGTGAKITVNNPINNRRESGCSITPYVEGYALTSGHCAEMMDDNSLVPLSPHSEVKVYTNGREFIVGKIVSTHMESDDVDVALIQLAEGVRMKYRGLDYSVNKLDPGNRVTLYGSTTTLAQGMTTGFYITSKKQTNRIKSDAVVQPGDSGGAVIGSRGDVVGVIQGFGYGTQQEEIKEPFDKGVAQGKTYSDGVFVPLSEISPLVDPIIQELKNKSRPTIQELSKEQRRIAK